MSELDSLKNRALDQLAACNDESSLRSWNTHYFGKNGEMLAALKKVSELPPESRKVGFPCGWNITKIEMWG